MTRAFNPRGTPTKSQEAGSLRRRHRSSPYTHEAAARSLIDLPSAIAYKQRSESVETPQGAEVPPTSRSYRIRGQHTAWTTTGPLRDLSTTDYELAQGEIFDPPMLRSSQPLETTKCMRQFLLHNLMFTYGIDLYHFRNQLHDAGYDLLSLAEKDYMLALSQNLRLVQNRVHNNRHSLLVTEECSRIVEDVVVPAHNLDIDPGYICEQLIRFPDHNFDKDKHDNAYIFSQTTRRRSIWRGLLKWDTKEACTHLARCLVSDDFVVERIAPSQQVRVMIGINIESFSEEHCKKGIDMGSVERVIHVSEDIQRMLDVVILRAQMPEQSAQSLQHRNSISASLLQRPVHLGHKLSTRWNGTPLAHLSGVLETEPDRIY